MTTESPALRNSVASALPTPGYSTSKSAKITKTCLTSVAVQKCCNDRRGHTLGAPCDDHIIGGLEIFALPFAGCYGLLGRAACKRQSLAVKIRHMNGRNSTIERKVEVMWGSGHAWHYLCRWCRCDAWSHLGCIFSHIALYNAMGPRKSCRGASHLPIQVRQMVVFIHVSIGSWKHPCSRCVMCKSAPLLYIDWTGL